MNSHEKASWVRERKTSEVASLYFSDFNIDALQDGIRYKVFTETQKVISPQSNFDLVTTMRSVYLQYGQNLPDRIVEQVRALNCLVLKFCVKRIVSEIGARQQYLKDITQDGYSQVLMGRAENVSSKGDRSLTGRSW